MLLRNKVIPVGMVVGLLPCIASAASTWELGNEASYYWGDYGTSSTIDLFYDATYLQFRHERLKLKLTIPYVSVSGLPTGGFVAGGGNVLTGRGARGKQGTHSASGWGDIWLSGHYALVPSTPTHPGLGVYSKVKFGTASHSDGLGTGRNDYEFGAGINARWGASGYPFADVGYRFVGSPAGYSLNDVLTYDVGYEYAASERSVLTGKFVGQQSEINGQSDPADLLFSWDYRLSTRGGFKLFADKGLSNGSPDFGIGVGAHLNF